MNIVDSVFPQEWEACNFDHPLTPFWRIQYFPLSLSVKSKVLLFAPDIESRYIIDKERKQNKDVWGM